MTLFMRYFVITAFIFFSLPSWVTVFTLLILFFSPLKYYARLIFISWCFIFCYFNFYWPVELPALANNKKILVTGVIESKPLTKNKVTKFILATDDYKLNNKNIKLRLQVSVYHHKLNFYQGDNLTALIKVKQFRNYQNPASKNYHLQQRIKGLSGKGYLVKLIHLQSKQISFLNKVRARVLHIINKLYQQRSAKALMSSLLIGDRSQLASSDWQRFILTGTSHLIAISGLHVGLIVLVSYYLAFYIWRSFAFLCFYLAAHRAAALLALISSLFYCLLAGFSISTQRAFLMSLVFLSAKILNKKTSVWHSYFLAMFLVVLCCPLSILALGFYLSFFVVFILLWFATGSKWQFITMQLKIWLLLLPVSLYCFNFYTLVSMPANLLAIPIVSFIILPLGFMSIFLFGILPNLAAILSALVEWSIYYLNSYLDYLVSFKKLALNYALTELWQVIIISVLIFYGLEKNKKYEWLVVILISFIIISPWHFTMPLKQANIAMLDVGQGLAVVIKTKNHTLLYDTGGKYSSGFDLGQAVVVPYLIYKKTYQIDALVISHEDLDHNGGYQSLKSNFNIKKVYRNGKAGFENCHNANSWYWDGVKFSFLSADKVNIVSRNDNSCVLVIENDYQRIILPGDIEKSTEIKLVNKYKKNLKTTVLISPHHGSKTSSSDVFLKATLPNFVFIASGKDNRYKLPHSLILKRYNKLSINVLNTAECGMITWNLINSLTVVNPKTYLKSCW